MHMKETHLSTISPFSYSNYHNYEHCSGKKIASYAAESRGPNMALI